MWDWNTLLCLWVIHPSIHPSNGATAHIGPWPPQWGSVTAVFLWCGVVSPTPNPRPGGPGLRIYVPRGQGGPTPDLEDQASVCMSPGDRVAQLYPRALGSSGTSGVPLPVPTIVGPWGAWVIPVILRTTHSPDFWRRFLHAKRQRHLPRKITAASRLICRAS
jgi:hypothetical protein